MVWLVSGIERHLEWVTIGGFIPAAQLPGAAGGPAL